MSRASPPAQLQRRIGSGTDPTAASLRRAHSGDAQGLSALHDSLFAAPWSVSEMRELIDEPANFCLMLEMPFGPAGFIICRSAADEAEVLSLGVARACQRLGRGSLLLEAACAKAASRGASAMFLEVDVDNSAALGLYQRAGFFVVGRRKGYYRKSSSEPHQGAAGRARDALVMKRNLAEAPAPDEALR